jgi:hypothetical protein
MVIANPKKVRGGFLVFVTFGVIFLVSARMYPQVAGATLSGTVTDQSGAIIPNTQISIKNMATGVTRAVTADPAGFYTAPNLIPGTYEVTATASGFSTEVRSGITLTIGAQQALNLTLQVGRVTERVQVAGEAPAVQLATSSISAVVNSTTVRELPLNGRSWTDLAALQPGVGTIQTQPPFTVGPDRGNRGFGAQISISGARPQQNNYRLDGISMNDYANGAPGSVLGGNLGVDAIQEFSVLSTNYTAEYGKTSGGVINAITRSGTNQFHGSAYEFLRNSALDARNFFDVGSTPPFRRNQFGGSGGGPIRKDRTFIFGDYEGIRQSKGISALGDVPSVAARAGLLCSNPVPAPPDPNAPCTPTQLPVGPNTDANGVDISAKKYLDALFFPLPNAGPVPGGNGDTGFFSFVGSQTVSENFLTNRIDHKFSDKDSISGSYMFDRTTFSAPGQLDTVLLGNLTLRQLFTIEETHIFNPNLVNTVRGGYNRESVNNDQSLKAINPAAADLSLGAEPGRAAAAVVISGVPPGFTGGIGGNSTYFYRWNSFQGYDDAFLTRGTHSVKFGVAVERMQLNSLSVFTPTGAFNFGSLQAFLTNHPKKYNSGIASTLQPRGTRYTLFGGYIQDDWRWRRNVTLNLGLRYEMLTVPTEVEGKLPGLTKITDPLPHCGKLYPGCAGTAPFFSNPTLRNFAPRVGFAWDPFNNGKTAVRGGFGIFDSLPLPYEFTLGNSQAAPFFANGTVVAPALPPGSFFSGAAQLLQLNTLNGYYVDPHPHRNYVMQWNFNVQQEITPTVAAMAGYVGSRGIHMPFSADEINLVIPTLTSAGYVWPGGQGVGIGNGSRINPNFGQIRGQIFQGNSFFDALELAVTKRMSHGIQFQTSYTWGKSIDNNSATLAGDQFSNSVSSLLWFDAKRLTRALSDFNIGRTLVISTTWQVPALHSISGPAAWLVNGWELGGIFKANDGVPYTATWNTGGDAAGTLSADAYDYPNRLTGPGCATLVNPGNPNHYVKTQCFTLPTAPSMAFWNANCDTTSPVFGPNGTTEPFPVCFNLRGNAGRNIITGPGIQNLDFSVFKNNPIKRFGENFNVQFRAEFFNILNHANFGTPVVANGEADLFDGTGAPIGSVGQLTTTSTTAREIQFALKLVW